MQTLAAFLRSHREEILRAWMADAATLPAAQPLRRAELRDHIPHLLDAIAAALDRNDLTSTPAQDLPLVHAAERFREGYDLRQVVAEYRQLRRAIHSAYAADAADLSPEARGRIPALTALNEHLDWAIADAVEHFSAERENARQILIGILGHDLRNPLNLIGMGVELILRKVKGLEAHEANLLQRMGVATQRMRRLIDDLLAYAMTTSGSGIPVTRVDVDLRDVIRTTVAEFAEAHESRDVRCLAAETPGDLRGCFDPDRVAQVVSNLVSNALSHGGDPVVVAPSDLGDAVGIDVSSSGEVREDLRPFIFKPFATAAKGQGSGLGLFIVKQVVSAHGGEAQVLHEPGRTVFKVRLPKRA